MFNADSSIRTQSVPSHCISCPVVVPSSNFARVTFASSILFVVTAPSASSSVSIPPSSTSKVKGSACVPVPFSARDPFNVASVTSFPTIPSVSVMFSNVSSTRTQSVPFHRMSCPEVVPLAILSRVTASFAISSSRIVLFNILFEVTALLASSFSVIPSGETPSVYGSPASPFPERVKVPSVTSTTSLPITPSASEICRSDSKISCHSPSAPAFPFHKIICLVRSSPSEKIRKGSTELIAIFSPRIVPLAISLPSIEKFCMLLPVISPTSKL